MEVQYQPDTHDYYVAQQYVSRSVVRGSYWRMVPKILGGIFGFCFALGAIAIVNFYNTSRLSNLYELTWGLALTAIGLVVLFFGSYMYNRVLKSRMFGPAGPYRSQHTIRLDSHHMVVTVNNNKYSYSYSGILRVDEDRNYVYVFIDNGAAFYIPSKAFESTEDKKAFIMAVSGVDAGG